MRFDIDTKKAKTMATRLQAYLAQNPKQKLSRSSAIEAVARTLGFNNRSEMAARLADTPKTSMPVSRSAAAAAALADLLDEEIEACARSLVSRGRANLPNGAFSPAMHAEGPGSNALLEVEDALAEALMSDPSRFSLLHAALLQANELPLALEQREDLRDACAMALVNESLVRAERLWNETPSTVR